MTKIISASELLQKNLIIPEYQRAYTWGEKNISKMIEDFEDFLGSDYQHLEYYLGTILLHKEKKDDGKTRFNIIDGQQRITTLLLILKVSNQKSFLDPVDIIYDNPKSQFRINENYKTITVLLKEKLDFIDKIFEKIRFTIIETENVDDSFTFFDTQNNRGVQPSVLVLLKSFNLRAIPKNKFDIQKQCALTWEKHEKLQKDNDSYLSEESEKLEWLIKVFFYRVRNWRSNQKADFGSYDSFRDQFTKNLRKSENESYKKYPNFINQITIKNDIVLIQKSKNSDWFEFAVRQPIYEGEGFFLFVDHYAKLLDNLMKVNIYHGKTFQALVSVHKSGSRFIASFLSIVSLTYYDRFGEDRLEEFVKNLNLLLANIRLIQDRILKQTMDIQFIRGENIYFKQNILDFISGAFDAEEVIKGIKNSAVIEEKKDGVQGVFSKKYKEFWGENNG